MRKINIDNLVAVSVSNRHTEKVDPLLFLRINEDFTQLKGIWSKAFFIFIIERADNIRLKHCGIKLHLEMRVFDGEIYDRYFKPYILDMKRAFSVTQDFSDIHTHIVNSLVEFGDREYIILNKLLYNATNLYGQLDKSLPMDMVKEIEIIYDNF